jgi:hypothetical protein
MVLPLSDTLATVSVFGADWETKERARDRIRAGCSACSASAVLSAGQAACHYEALLKQAGRLAAGYPDAAAAGLG